MDIALKPGDHFHIILDDGRDDPDTMPEMCVTFTEDGQLHINGHGNMPKLEINTGEATEPEPDDVSKHN